MNQIIISVIMPAYNVDKWIGSSIESLLLQTFKDFELIIVNDGSTDNTEKIAIEFSKIDSRIKVLTLDTNKGIVDALNAGLKVARGKYIARMDSDDIATPERLEKQLSFLISKPDFALVGCQMLSIDESGRHHGISPCPITYEEARLVLQYSSPVPHIWMCRSDVYLKLGGYRQLAPAEDYDFILRLDSLGLKYCNHPEPLMMIRSRVGNTASVAPLRQRKVQNYVLSLYEERSSTGKDDSFSAEAFRKATQSMLITEFFHKRSSIYLARSVQASGVFSQALNLLAAVILSRYNAQYVWRRLIYRRKLRRKSL